MFFFYLIIFFILGTLIGSFLNAFVLRYNTGLSIASGRSKCFSCSKTLDWHELVPIFSFLALRGKCSGCKSKISIQYPLIEFITGVVFVLVFWKIGFGLLLPFYLIAASLLVAISIYDFKHKIIPDGMVFSFAVVSLAILILRLGFVNLFSINGALDFSSGIILFAFFASIWLLSSGRAMGFGDAKLALGVGWLLGFSGGILAIVFAFWIGALVSLCLIALHKLNLFRSSLTIKSEIPFAPFIILGLLLEFCTGWGVMKIAFLFDLFK